MEQRVMHSATRYYGGKFALATWIIKFFPAHYNYVEPCGGVASVLLQKPRSKLEIYNDLDSNIVNFFRILRERTDELAQQIKYTPWSREEFVISLTPCEDPLERARRFFVMCNLSMAANPVSGWRRYVDYRKSTIATLKTNHFPSIADRLRHVQLENSDAFYVIKNYDTNGSLIYFDPPYVEETRTDKNQYKIDWRGDSLHHEAAALLRKCKAHVVVSGYPSKLYEELYEQHGWLRYDKKAINGQGNEMTECVWLAPRTAREISQPQQLGLIQDAPNH